MIVPVVHPLSSPSRWAASAAISSGFPTRPSGFTRPNAASIASGSSLASMRSWSIVVSTGPGAIALQRILRGAHSTARTRASMWSAAFDTA